MTQRFSFSRRGFTLIELLVVVVIIAILAGILIPVLGMVQRKAYSAKCLRNLNQVGIGISGYCNDHDDVLPGPLSEGQYSKWKTGDPKAKGALVQFLEPYLYTHEDKSSTPPPETVMFCPSWERARKGINPPGPVFVLNFEDRLVDYGDRVPWGDAETNTQPVKRSMLTAWRITDPKKKVNTEQELMPLSQTWAIKDGDQEDYSNADHQPSFLGELPPKAVHEDHRNVLYYDFHAGSMKLDDTVMN